VIADGNRRLFERFAGLIFLAGEAVGFQMPPGFGERLKSRGEFRVSARHQRNGNDPGLGGWGRLGRTCLGQHHAGHSPVGVFKLLIEDQNRGCQFADLVDSQVERGMAAAYQDPGGLEIRVSKGGFLRRVCFDCDLAISGGHAALALRAPIGTVISVFPC
jgi:hypothetical protein